VLDRRDGAVRWARSAGRPETPKLFVAAGDRVVRLDRGALEAFATADGRSLWRTSGVHRGPDHDAWLTAGQDVLVWQTSSDGRAVTAYRLDTGGRRWRLGGLAEPAVVGVGPAGVAVVSAIERGQRHQLLLVDPGSGRVRWRRPLPGPLLLDMNPAVDRLALVTEAEVVLVTNGPRLGPPVTLAAYAARDGAVRWRVPVQAGGWPTWTSNGRLLVVGSPPAARTPEMSLTAVDVRAGRVLWRSPLPMHADRPAAALGSGAVIQVWDPPRACARGGDLGTADAGPAGDG
jgi:outer membrane protein assembly factor BamB